MKFPKKVLSYVIIASLAIAHTPAFGLFGFDDENSEKSGLIESVTAYGLLAPAMYASNVMKHNIQCEELTRQSKGIFAIGSNSSQLLSTITLLAGAHSLYTAPGWHKVWGASSALISGYTLYTNMQIQPSSEAWGFAGMSAALAVIGIGCYAFSKYVSKKEKELKEKKERLAQLTSTSSQSPN